MVTNPLMGTMTAMAIMISIIMGEITLTMATTPMAKTIMIAIIKRIMIATTIVTTRSTKAMNIQKNTVMLAHTEVMAHIMASTMAMVLILPRKVTPAIAMVIIMQATLDTAATTL